MQTIACHTPDMTFGICTALEIKRQRKPKGQPRKDNTEKLATLGTIYRTDSSTQKTTTQKSKIMNITDLINKSGMNPCGREG